MPAGSGALDAATRTNVGNGPVWLTETTAHNLTDAQKRCNYPHRLFWRVFATRMIPPPNK
jgi:hypothetical protein